MVPAHHVSPGCAYSASLIMQSLYQACLRRTSSRCPASSVMNALLHAITECIHRRTAPARFMAALSHLEAGDVAGPTTTCDEHIVESELNNVRPVELFFQNWSYMS